jgi:hypothetical protein
VRTSLAARRFVGRNRPQEARCTKPRIGSRSRPHYAFRSSESGGPLHGAHQAPGLARADLARDRWLAAVQAIGLRRKKRAIGEWRVRCYPVLGNCRHGGQACPRHAAPQCCRYRLWSHRPYHGRGCYRTAVSTRPSMPPNCRPTRRLMWPPAPSASRHWSTISITCRKLQAWSRRRWATPTNISRL